MGVIVLYKNQDGSDWPISNMGSYLAFVRKLELDEDSYDLMMSGNTKYIFRL